ERFNPEIIEMHAKMIETKACNEDLEQKISIITTLGFLFFPHFKSSSVISAIGVLKLITKFSGRDLFKFIDHSIIFMLKSVRSRLNPEKVDDEKKLAQREQGRSLYLDSIQEKRMEEESKKRDPIECNVTRRADFIPKEEIEEETRSLAVHKFEEVLTKDYQILNEDQFHQWTEIYVKDVETGRMSQAQAIEQATKIMVLSKIIEKNPDPIVVSEKSNNEHQPSESKTEVAKDQVVAKSINPEEVEKHSKGLGSVYIPSRFKVSEADLNRVGLSQNVKLSEKELKSRGLSLEKAYYFNDHTPSREEVDFWRENGWKVANFDGRLVLISERLLSVIAAKYPPKSAVETFFEGANHAILTLELKIFDMLRS
ncbi:MAG: hypothetical protein KDK71_06305, partial [Chlamydiia bacterium]|nr:hypothetical protein [Chlamydiia bacterium]